MVKIERIYYYCSQSLNISVSLIHSSNLITTPSSCIGKIKGIFRNINYVDMFYISYTRTQYNIVSTDNLETLFLDSGHENECRKNKNKNKSVKNKMFDIETKIYSKITS